MDFFDILSFCCVKKQHITFWHKHGRCYEALGLRAVCWVWCQLSTLKTRVFRLYPWERKCLESLCWQTSAGLVFLWFLCRENIVEPLEELLLPPQSHHGAAALAAPHRQEQRPCPHITSTEPHVNFTSVHLFESEIPVVASFCAEYL